MSEKKTQDGISLTDILRVATQAGATIREGSKHAYQLNYPRMRPCPIATSTHARRMVTPWLAQATGRDRQEIYQALREGDWEYS